MIEPSLFDPPLPVDYCWVCDRTREIQPTGCDPHCLEQDTHDTD